MSECSLDKLDYYNHLFFQGQCCPLYLIVQFKTRNNTCNDKTDKYLYLMCSVWCFSTDYHMEDETNLEFILIQIYHV